MNTYLIIASLLTVVLAMAHSFLGEIKLLRHLKDENLPTMKGIPAMLKMDGFAKKTIRFVWHVTSIFGLGFAAILYHFAKLEVLDANEIMVIKIIGVAMLLSGIITLIISKGSHLGWILFIAIGVFCWLAV